jgi:hypothetical protein
MQSGVDMFGDVMGSLKGSKKPPKPAEYPQGGYYPQQDYYHEMYQPIIAQPVTSSAYGGYYYNSPTDFNSQPSSYERSTQPKGFGVSNFVHNEQETTRKPLPMKGKGKVGKMLKETSANATADLINSGSDRAVHEMDTRGKGIKGKGKTGTMLKETSANATADLINSGSTRAVHEMDTRGKGLKKGSPEMKERMAKMRAMRKKS